LDRFFSLLWYVFLLTGLLCIMNPGTALAAGGDIIISGPGLNNSEPVTITQAQLRGESPLSDGTTYLKQQDIIYSTINTWPTKSWYRGKGVFLTDLLEAAGGLNPDATQIRFISRDSFESNFSVQEIVYTPRYRFPNFMDTGLPGHLPGDASDRVEVETIIAHESFYAHDYDDILNEENFSKADANHLLYGQRAVTEQTNARFAKYVTRIEVLTEPLLKWDNPTADPLPPLPGGVVPVGTLVELHSPNDDEDKVHYTLDGSDPTIESPMYNWIASRWWSSRGNELDEINHPIEITQDTVIKAKVIGPGRADSDIVTFEYKVPPLPPALIPDSTDNKVGRDIEIIFTDNEAWRNAVIDVSIEGSSLEQDKYALEPGKVIIYADVFSGTGTYKITIRAEGYQDAIVHQIITGGTGGPGGDLKRPPALTDDTGENFVGEPIRITFTDNEAWRQSIYEIEVDGEVLRKSEYTIGKGYIEIAAGIFKSPGTYQVIVSAEGYDDASVSQKIIDDKNVVLTITGEGVVKARSYTLEELEEMDQHRYEYSVVNTWPSKQWYVGKGVLLEDLLKGAGGITKDATLVKVFSSDSYVMTFTVKELLKEKRYCFPNFKEGGGDGDGHIPGSSKGKEEVKSILALIGADGLDLPDDKDMNDRNSLHLMMGQRAVTEQTGPLFVKKVKKIEVLTDPIDQWDEPKADPAGGTVPAGTLVELSNKNMDIDKIHYTLDGSEPTLQSPMYNWIAKRWWSSRGEKTVAEINHPIEITEDTVIKAITIGPGKEPSDVVTFSYKVEEGEPSKSDTVSADQDSTVSLGNEVSIGIPAGAFSAGSKVEVKIERVETPPPAPAGLRIVGSVYEFTIDGEKSYSFLKKVTITFRFNPQDFDAGEIPSIYRYNEELAAWENLGGIVKDDTISVEVDHLSKYALMAPVKLTEQALADIAGHWAEESIKEMVNLGAVSGYPDGTFRPNDKITRAEFATILVKALKLEKKSGKVFDDTSGYWAEEAISTAASHGIISGYDDHIFGVKDAVTREQMAAIMVRAGQFAQVLEEVFFKDQDHISAWAKNAVMIAVKHGIINGYPDRTLRPRHTATRAEAVSVIWKVIKGFGQEDA
jgi:DMSO/TMAO reductase YedYZ molybdopterin-dependent catalytic subunit